MGNLPEMQSLSTGLSEQIAKAAGIRALSAGLSEQLVKAAGIQSVSAGLSEQISKAAGIQSLSAGLSEQLLKAAGIQSVSAGLSEQIARAAGIQSLSAGLSEQLLKAAGIQSVSAGLSEQIARAAGIQSLSAGLSEQIVKAAGINQWGGASLVDSWSALKFRTRSRQKDFASIEPEPSSYSEHLTTPADYFAESEGDIGSMDDLHHAIRVLTEKAQAVPLVWRGQQRADWGMHSSLFIALMRRNGVVQPERRPRGVQPFPTEDDMVAAEKAVLRVARESWRFNGLSALEILARLQHQGAPTRMLDVTRNPYIAAWFAVEANDEHDEHDARLFALATTPVPRASEVIRDDLFQLVAGSVEPFWHALKDNDDRQQLDWGTGANRRVWVPPEYDPRIAAQNAAFVLDGVPMVSNTARRHFKTSDGHYWSKADLLASSSIYARMLSVRRKPQPNAPGLAPTFSFRIRREAKGEIRQMMERWFGYSRATIYPDIQGLAQHIRSAFTDILDD